MSGVDKSNGSDVVIRPQVVDPSKGIENVVLPSSVVDAAVEGQENDIRDQLEALVHLSHSVSDTSPDDAYDFLADKAVHADVESVIAGVSSLVDEGGEKAA